MISLPLTIFYGLFILLTLGVGISGYKKNKSNKAHQSFLLFCVSAIGWIVSLYLGFHFGDYLTVGLSTFFFRLVFAFGFICLGSLPLFFYYFPRKIQFVPGFLKWIYVCFLVYVIVLSGFTPYVYESAVIVDPTVAYIEDVLGRDYIFYTVSSLLLFILAIVFGIIQVVNFTGIEKKKSKLSIVGLGLFSFSGIMTNVVLPNFGILVFQLEAPLFCLFYIIPTFYSIFKYRFLDISLTFQRFLFLLTHISFYVSLGVWSFFLPQSLQLILLFFIFVMVLFAREKIAFFFDRLWNYIFFQKPLNKIQEIKASLKEFQASFDLGLRRLVQILQVTDGRYLPASELKDFSHLVQYFSDHPKEELVQDEIEYVLNNEIEQTRDLFNVKKEMDDMMIAIAIPVFREKILLGILLLEKTIDGHLLSTQEVRQARSVIHEATVYIASTEEYNRSVKNPLEKGSVPAGFMNNLLHEIRSPLMVARTTQELSEWKHSYPEEVLQLESKESSLSGVTRKLDRISLAFEWNQAIVPLQKSFIHVEKLLDPIKDLFEVDKKTIFLVFSNQTLKEAWMEVDVASVKSAIVEIIKNGFFFNNRDEKEVTVEIFEQEANLFLIITDNGIGIEKKYWENVFDLLFVVSESRNPAECGLGVGATQARGVMRSHEGDCRIIESSENGTSVEIKIPLSEV